MCTGTECGTTNRYGSLCDPDGCDFNSFRMGNQSFYGPHEIVDTTQKFTVVTQFLTSTNSSSGALSEIRRLYVQNGKVIQNSNVNIPGMEAYDSITTAYCDAQKTAFGDTTSFQDNGGLTNMGAAFNTGMVLVLSVWDDYAVNMLWLDSDYPTTSPATQPGVARGTCSTSSGVPSVIETSNASASVTYSNIRFGDIGSTYSTTTTTPPVTTPPGGGSGTGSGNPPTQTQWGQW